MTALVFIACLAASPDTCQSHRVPLAEATPWVCLMGAQGMLAQWAVANPGWRVVRWRCEMGRDA